MVIITPIDCILEFGMIRKKYDNQKACVGAFSTHDEVSPILLNGEKFSKMLHIKK